MKNLRIPYLYRVDNPELNLINGSFRDNTIDIVDKMLNNEPVQFKNKEILMSKIRIVLNELISNLWKYERGNPFSVGVDIKGNIVYLYMFIIGKDLDYDKIKKRIHELDNKSQIEFDYEMDGKGYYTCSKLADHFRVANIVDEVYTKELVFGFNVEYF